MPLPGAREYRSWARTFWTRHWHLRFDELADSLNDALLLFLSGVPEGSARSVNRHGSL